MSNVTRRVVYVPCRYKAMGAPDGLHSRLTAWEGYERITIIYDVLGREIGRSSTYVETATTKTEG